MGADHISHLYSYCLLTQGHIAQGLEVQGWHVCTEFSVVCLITLVGHVGAMGSVREATEI